MKKKGFTLIELLAVIVILAVIALITIPLISNVIKSAKRSAFKVSVEHLSENVYFHYSKDWLIEGMDEDKVFNFDTLENIDLLTVSGKLPSSGTITINPRGKISISVSDGAFCAVKSIDEDKIQVGDIVDGICQITGEKVNNCPYIVGHTWEFDYEEENDSGIEQLFKIPCQGYYRLEVWGAQGGNFSIGSRDFSSGYGGYSTGYINLNENTNLYINVGGKGESCTTASSSVACTTSAAYNGGSSCSTLTGYSSSFGTFGCGAGGGATHIALSSGLLSTLENNQDNLLIVAGGGGGASASNAPYNYGHGGSGGGYQGNKNISEGNDARTRTGGTQTTGASFGNGSNGGGGGYYGGYGDISGGAGGAGYIGNTNLISKSMYCYNCDESNDIQTKTRSVLSSSQEPTKYIAKQGSGYARITYLGSNINPSTQYEEGNIWVYSYKEETGEGVEQIFNVPINGEYKLEVWGAQGGGNTSYIGGYGGYSIGKVSLNKDSKLYINVGGSGNICNSNSCSVLGGYNGGGSGKGTSGCNSSQLVMSGGGATHVALSSGLLSMFENNQDKLLIVAGGGGGASYCNGYNYANGGHGGGFTAVGSINRGAQDWKMNGGEAAIGGTQEVGYQFGLGEGSLTAGSTGAGGGYYGGKNTNINGSGGGSGYIGNSLLTNKYMYCYNCPTSTEVDTYTKSNGTSSCTNESPISDCSKQGNGYVKITLLKIK